MRKRLQAVLIGVLLGGIIAGLGRMEVMAKPALPEPPLPPDAHWELASEGRASDWQVYLTGSDVSDIALDGDVLWAASNGGLLRWERSTGSVVQYLAPTFPLPSNSLSDVLLYEGKLYISGKGGVAIFDRQEQWTLYTEADIGMPIGFHAPMAMVEDVLWVVGESGLAYLFPNGHWEHTYYGQDTLPEYQIDQLRVRDLEAYIVVALGPTTDAERRVLRLNDGVWQEVDDLTLQYLETPDGALWKALYSEVFKSTDGGLTWTTVLADDRYCLLLVDTDGRVYVAADDTVLVLENDAIVERYSFTDGGPELNYINIIQWDEAGRLWIATDGRGLTLFDGERWYNWQDGDAGMREDCIRGMALGAGKLYAGTHGSAGTGGVNVLDIATLTWTNFWPGESELSGGGVDGIAVDAGGRVYFPTSVGVLDIFDHGDWAHHVIPALPERHIFSFSEAVLDAQGNYWVGIVGFGLYRYDGQNWILYEMPGDVTALELDATGRLWVGTTNGLIVRDVGEQWFYYGRDALPVQQTWINDIAVDLMGRAWIITTQDLLVFNGQEWRAFSSDVAGTSVWGDAVGIDIHGNVWVEVGQGLAQYRGELDFASFTELGRATQVLKESEIVHDIGSTPESYADSVVLLSALCCGSGLCLLLTVAMGGVVIYLALRQPKHASEVALSADVAPDEIDEIAPSTELTP